MAANPAESSDGPDSPILHRRVAFVGKLGGVNRREAKSIVRRLGGVMLEKIDPSANLIVIGADVIPMGEPDELLAPWISEGVADQRIDVIDETEFWQRVGVVEPEMDVAQLYTPAMLAGLLEVPIATIRRWHRRGLITPTRQVKRLPYFDFQEVALARRIAELVASGTNPAAIEKRLSQLAERYPNLSRPLTQLSIIVEGQRLLLRQGDGLIEPNGQRRFDFETNAGEPLDNSTSSIPFPSADAIESQRVSPTSIDQIVTKEDFLRLAFELEDENELDAAIEVYRSLLFAYGPSADVCFRIAELMYQLGNLAAARERYSMAVELEESFVEARASLGCVLVELDQQELARAAFEGVLKHHEAYPDVHFHLARLLDELGQRELAEPHWSRFLELTPHSPWAAEARERVAEISDHVEAGNELG
ncbi:MAG: MerR family transcriptional regulator [Planctomycetota bacterium]